MTREGHTTIGVRRETYEVLKRLSERTGRSMAEILDRLVKGVDSDSQVCIMESEGRGDDKPRT